MNGGDAGFPGSAIDATPAVTGDTLLRGHSTLCGGDGFPSMFGTIVAQPALVMTIAGATTARVLAVPNAPQLLGDALFVQAFQVDGALVRTSTAFGGVGR